MKKQTLIGIIVWVVLFAVILTLASFYDLELNKAIGNANSVFGQFFRFFGEFWGYFFIPVACAFLFGACTIDNKVGIVLKIFWGIATFVGWFLVCRYTMGQFSGTSYGFPADMLPYRFLTLYSVIFALGLTGMSLFAVSKMDKKVLAKLAILAVVMLLALAISMAVTEVLKRIWTRQRFRNMPIGNGDQDASGFTPWWMPNLGKNKNANNPDYYTYYVPDSAGAPESDAFKSFPSGHTCSAALSFVILYLPELFEKLKKHKIIYILVAAAFTVLVGISRIVNRAHFLSDVLFGATIGTLSCFASFAIVNAFRKAASKGKKMSKVFVCMGAYNEVIQEQTETTSEVVEDSTAETENKEVVEEKIENTEDNKD
ncbi:MAG: phosphatase PAP2 family protein [Clostridia bacterium]|nr:phosphatase PAP2 family protein [Clostridia bacterium]